MNIVEKLKWRYAVKKFDSEKIVSKEKIEKIKETFNLTATSYGLQPISLLIIKNKDIQTELMAYSYNQPQVVQASHILVFCIKNTFLYFSVQPQHGIRRKLLKYCLIC